MFINMIYFCYFIISSQGSRKKKLFVFRSYLIGKES